MKKINFLIGLMLISALAFAQGIRFEENLSWKEVLKKAKEKNKLIFIDCYATWCGPCKMMDEQVYPKTAVGDVVNKDFISIKVQFDKTEKDSPYIKSWYADADKLNDEFKIGALPSFIFLSPEGEPLHRGQGFLNEKAFLALVNEAKDPQKQFYALLTKYKSGKLPVAELRSYSEKAKAFGERDLAREMAKTYKEQYLDQLPDAQLFTKENFEFFSSNSTIFEPSDRIVRYFAQNDDSVSRAIPYPKYVYNVLKSFATQKVINPILYTAEKKVITSEPDWQNLRIKVAAVVGKRFAEEVIMDTQHDFYKGTRNWNKFISVVNQRLSKYPPKAEGGPGGDLTALNSDAWTIFENCHDKKMLKAALRWSEITVLPGEKIDVYTSFLDTKANLIYKLGDRQKALKIQALAVAVEEKKSKTKIPEDSGIWQSYVKMQKGIPTWEQ